AVPGHNAVMPADAAPRVAYQARTAVEAPRAARPVHHRHRATPVRRALLARIAAPLPIRQWPGAGPVIGTMPAGSRYYHQSIDAWVLRRAWDGPHGRVP